MIRVRLSAVACCCSLLTVIDMIACGQPRPEAPRWQPDRAYIGRIDRAAHVEEYSLQPPKGYHMAVANAAWTAKMVAWSGRQRDDGTRPVVMLGLYTPPSRDTTRRTVAQLAEKLLASVRRNRTEWQQTRAETGNVNGFVFARIRWTGTEPLHKRRMQGFTYVAFDGARVLHLSSQDVLPGAKETLPLAEASVLTFRKR